ncbi:MAG: oligosaccharide flippase family protein [Chloroflexota bacterium]|jgi:O-antigen/teichoic acid export membrane protein
MITSQIRRSRWDLLIGLSYLLLPLLLYAGVSIGPQTMLPVDNLFQWPPWSSHAEQFNALIPHNALISDLVIQNYAWKRFILQSLGNGEIPLWNPHLFAGAPFLANGQHSALYPFGILFLVLPLAKAYGWFALSQLWVAGIFMYFFGRILNMQRGSAALAGFVYQGAGFLVISAAVFPMIAGAVVWLPFLLGCIERVITASAEPGTNGNRTILWVAAGALVLGSQVLAGHAEFTYYTLLVMALFASWRLTVAWLAARRSPAEPSAKPPGPSWWRALLRPALWVGAMMILGLMIAAIQLVPLFEVGQVNFRVGSATFSEVRGWAFPWRNALTFLLPNFFGNPTHHGFRDVFSGQWTPLVTNFYGNLNPHGPYTTSWGLKNYVESATYLGILPLILAGIGALAIFRRQAAGFIRKTHSLFFLGLGFFSIAFIFGTPLYALLFYGLPFIDQLHTPFRWVFPLALAVAVLAGFGADTVSDIRKANTKGGRLLANSRFTVVDGLGGLALVAGLLVLAATIVSRLAFDVLHPLIEELFLGLAQAADAFPSAGSFYSYQFWQLLILGGMLAASGAVLLLSRRSWWIVLACALIVVDLAIAARGFNSAIDTSLFAHTPEALRWLEDQPGEWRLTTFDPYGSRVLNANTPWLYDLDDIRGYDSIIPKQFTNYMEAIEPQNGLQFNRIQPISALETLNSPLLDVLNVKYIATIDPIDLPKFRPVWEGDGLVIYENLAVAPRAYILPQTATAIVPDALTAMTELDPRHYVVVEAIDFLDEGVSPPAMPADLNPAIIESYRNNEVIVSASAQLPAWLILNDSYFPGWRAFIRPLGGEEDDEQEAPIIRVNGNFRGVQLEPGEWTVRYRYSPRSFQLGGLMSFMGVIILVFALGVWVWGRVYRPDRMSSTTRSVAKNSAAPMALNLFNKAIDFVFAAFYLRLLGPAAAGSFAIAIATAGIFEIIANYGLNILLIREVSQDRSRAGHFLLNSSILRLLTALIAALPILVYVWTTARGPNPLSPAELAAIALMMSGMVFSGLALGVSGLFYVYEQAEVPAAMSTVTTILKVALGVTVLLAGFSFVGLAAVSIVVNLVTLVLLTIISLRRFNLKGPWTLDSKLLAEMLRLGFPLMLIHLLQTIFISIDVLLLRQLLPNGEEVVGYYNSAWKWFNALQIIPAYFTLALFPIISRAIKEDMDSARRMYALSLKLMLLLALPTAALITFAAPLLIGLLGGQEFLPQGAIALQIIIWSIPFGWLNSVTNYVLIALGLERMQPRAFAIAVGFNIAGNWLLIPRYSFVAAAVITILSEVVLLLVFSYILRRRAVYLNAFQLASRPVLLTALMVAVMWVTNQVNLFVALAAGILIYLGGLFFLRIIGPDEQKAMAAILPLSWAGRLKWLTR